MSRKKKLPVFIGRGKRKELLEHPDAVTTRTDAATPWADGAEGVDAVDDVSGPDAAYVFTDHPEGYCASVELAEAVNTAVILGKPLLLTGRPGTGKSQLADRIAWEFDLLPVLRFEAQSMS